MSIPDKIMKLKDGKILYDDLRERVEDVKSDVETKYTKPVDGIPASDLAETYLTSETDPTVPAWAKASTKPTYTAAEVGALPDNTAIPSKTSDLTNDSNFVADANYVHTDSNYTAAEKSKLEGIAAGAEVNVNADWNAASGDAAILNKPTAVSAFTNDAGYITDPTVIIDDTAGTGDTDKVWSADKVLSELSGIESFDIEIVQSLPVSNIKTHTIYFVPKTGTTNDVYDEYIYINNAWEFIGNTEIDLSDYALKSELPTNVSDLANDANYVVSSALADVATSGSYNDLENTPTIPTVPTNVSAFTNDAGYLTQHQDISGKANIADLATVATSGSYNDLINTPTIPTVPTAVSAFTNDAGYLVAADISGKADTADLANVALSGDYDDLLNTPTIPTVPTNVSAFTNDAGYLTSHQSISGKADKVTSATSGNFAALDSNGNLTDSGHKHSDYLTSHQDITGKADKVSSATSGNFAALDSNGNLTDSGHKHADYLTSHQDITGKADKVSSATNGNFASLDSNGNLVDSGHKHSDYLTSVANMIGATSSANGAAGLVPAPTTYDTEKFLRGDGTWQLGGKPMVILSYGSSTWQEFLDAYNNNVIVYCRASSNSNPASGTQGRMAFMAYTSGTPINEVEFQYYRSVSSHSETQASDQVFIYKLNSSSQWSVTTREAGIKEIKPADGSPISVSYSSNIVTLDATVPTLTDLLDDTAGVGDTTVTWSADKIATELAGAGSVSDVQINSTSILSSGVANITTATSAQVKTGTSAQHPLTPGHQHEATFYGLAAAAGDSTQSQSSNAVGTYTDQAKAAIQSMLGVEPGLKVVRLI